MPVKQGRAGEMAAATPWRLQSRHVPTLPPSTLRGRRRTGHTARNGRPAAARRTLAALLAVFTLSLLANPQRPTLVPASIVRNSAPPPQAAPSKRHRLLRALPNGTGTGGEVDTTPP
jgi:plasmid stabilization system protein ParE